MLKPPCPTYRIRVAGGQEGLARDSLKNQDGPEVRDIRVLDRCRSQVCRRIHLLIDGRIPENFQNGDS